MISFWVMVLFLIGDSACSFSEMTAKEGSCVTVHITLLNTRKSGYIVWLKDAVWSDTAKDYEGTIVHSLKPDKRNASEFENRVSVGSTGDLYELTISNLRLEDSGKYMIRYYGEDDPSHKLSSSKMSLNVQENPCQVSVTGPELVQTGAKVILRCSTVGPCEYSPEWRSSGSGPTSSEVSDTQGAKTAQLRFKADWSHDGVEFSCWPSPSNDACTSRNITLAVGDMPQISVSGSCSRTAEEISCSCESHGNPSPSMEWRVSGLRVTNSTDRVIREEQLGNTGLRSSLTMHQSQGDMPTLLCVSTNTLGNSSLQLHLRSPQQHSGFGITSLLIGAAAGAGAMMMICLIMQHILKMKRHSQRSGSRMKDSEGIILSDGTATQDEESIHANKTTLSGASAVEKGDEGALHYATVDFSKLPGTGGEHGTGIVRGTSKRTSDYAMIRHKSREEREGGEEEGEEAKEEVEKQGQAELGTEREWAEARGEKEEESRPNLSPQASVNPEPKEEATYGNICPSRPTKRAR